MAAVLEAPAPGDDALENRRDWRVFTALTFLFGFGFAVYNGVFQNFIREVLKFNPEGLGSSESLREVPGLLAALTAGTLVALAESRVAALGLAITAVGIAATGLAGGWGSLVALSVFWSVGFHLWATVQGAITLSLAKGREGGRHLGRMTGVGSMATILGLGSALLVAFLFSTNRSVSGASVPPAVYHWLFLVGGLSIGVAAFLCTRLSPRASSHGPRLRWVIRREYRLYYFLIFLEGCRRQIFSIFATFTLILVYKVPLERMLLLQFVNQILISLTAPQMGRLVDRVGQRGPLTAYAIGLIAVFLGYATVGHLGVLYALYILDNVLFTFSVGFTTYLHRIVRPGELTPCLAMGTTMNHIAAVTVPVAGATLWQRTGNYQVPFWVGTGIAVVALLATRWLPKGRDERAAAHA